MKVTSLESQEGLRHEEPLMTCLDPAQSSSSEVARAWEVQGTHVPDGAPLSGSVRSAVFVSAFPFERAQTQISAAGRRSSYTVPSRPRRARRAAGPGFSGPEHSLVTARTLFPAEVVTTCPHGFPSPLPPVPARPLRLSQFTEAAAADWPRGPGSPDSRVCIAG